MKFEGMGFIFFIFIGLFIGSLGILNENFLFKIIWSFGGALIISFSMVALVQLNTNERKENENK